MATMTTMGIVRDGTPLLRMGDRQQRVDETKFLFAFE